MTPQGAPAPSHAPPQGAPAPRRLVLPPLIVDGDTEARASELDADGLPVDPDAVQQMKRAVQLAGPRWTTDRFHPPVRRWIAVEFAGIGRNRHQRRKAAAMARHASRAQGRS